MSNKSQLNKSKFTLVASIIIISLACALPFAGSKGGEIDPVVQTANALSTSLVATQTALAGSVELMASEIPSVDDAQQTAAAAATQAAQQLGLETSIPNITHTTMPGEPGPAKQVLNDESSASTANQKHAPAGSESYRLYNRLERPFTTDMSYRPDVDIEKAELFTDGSFYYITLYLNNTNPNSQNFTADYGVEIDTDSDGRGDYLVWTHAPQSTTWTIDAISVYVDVNNDVGAKTVLQSDAPSTGDGYETEIFSIQNTGNDPDAAWSRIAPSLSNAIQIAFKQSILDKPKSFMWLAWADDGLKKPGMFDYNDRFSESEAGSPLENDDNYPVKSLFAMDNTCRMVFGSAVTGTEPGVCGNTETIKITQQVNPTEIMNFTPPAINLP
jgi:hypothetical protein